MMQDVVGVAGLLLDEERHCQYVWSLMISNHCWHWSVWAYRALSLQGGHTLVSMHQLLARQ